MRGQIRIVRAVAAVVLLAAAIGSPASAQERWNRGQNVQPVFEGWERNDDGSFTMVFGYLNRNYEEQPIVRVGPNNFFEPGRPTAASRHFYNRRQQFVFTVRVPADWGREQDLVWSVTHNGRTDYAYGHLWPVWEIDAGVRRLNRGTSPYIYKATPNKGNIMVTLFYSWLPAQHPAQPASVHLDT